MNASTGTSPSRRAQTRAPAFLLLAAGGVAALIIAGQSWYHVPGIDVHFSGKDVTGGLAQALPGVVLAGALLMLTLRTLGCRIVGIVVGLAAIGMGWTGLIPQQPGAGEVASQVRQTTLRDVGQLQTVGWNFGYAGAALLALAGAVLMVRYAHWWPRRSDRFARPQAVANSAAGTGARTRRSVSTKPANAADPTAEADDIWKAIDIGQDPTDPDAGTSEAADPVFQRDQPGGE